MTRQAMPARPAEQGPGQAPAFDMTLDAARHTLGNAAALLEWLGRWQSATTQALLGWHQAVQAARLDLAQAQDGSALLAVQTQLATRQFELALQQAGGAWRLLLEDELRAAEHLRDEAVVLGERLLPYEGTSPAQPAAIAHAEEALKTWQHAWFDMTQRWAEALNTPLRH